MLEKITSKFKTVVTIGSQASDDAPFEKLGVLLNRNARDCSSLKFYANENHDAIDCLILNGRRSHADAEACLKAISPALKDNCTIILVGTLPECESATVRIDEMYVGELFKTACNLSECTDVVTYPEHSGITVGMLKGKQFQDADPISDKITYRWVKPRLPKMIGVVDTTTPTKKLKPAVEDKPKPTKRKKRNKRS